MPQAGVELTGNLVLLQKFKGRVLVADWSLSKHEYAAGGAVADTAAVPATAGPAQPGEGGREAASVGLAVDDGGGEGGGLEQGSDASESTGHAGSGGEDGAALEMRAEEKDMYRAVLGGLLGEGADAAAPAGGDKAAGAAAGGGVGKGAKRKRPEAGESTAAEAEAGAAEWEGERAQASDGHAQRSGSGVIDTQVFVRGLPVDVNSVELTARMSRFGDVKQCRCVLVPAGRVAARARCCCWRVCSRAGIDQARMHVMLHPRHTVHCVTVGRMRVYALWQGRARGSSGR